MIYEQLVSVEQLLHEEKIDKVVSLLKDNEDRISHLQNTNNQHLLSLLSRVNKRKLFYVQGVLTQLLHKRIVITDHSISICTEVKDPLEPYPSLTLRNLLSYLQQVSSFDIAVRQELSLLRTFAERVLTTHVATVLHNHYRYLAKRVLRTVHPVVLLSCKSLHLLRL